MSRIVVFHHALGPTPGVRGFAGALSAAGHEVRVPDLFEGRIFDTAEKGAGYAEEIGFDVLTDRARDAVADLPADLIYLGFSLGVVPAQRLARTRPGARGAVLCHSCLPSEGAWPREVPVRIHAMDRDPVFTGEGDARAARALITETPGATLSLYPGAGHLFAEPASPDHDAAAADLLLRRVLEFAARRSDA